VLAVSILVVQERISGSDHGRSGESLMQRCRRWFYDE